MNDKNNLKEDRKEINPAVDKGNYVIQVIDKDQVIKEILAVNATVRIVSIGEQTVAAMLR